jgi:hypothetical protein
LELGEVDEKKINAFREKYGNNREYTPEFGASCGVNFTETTTDVPQQEPYIAADPGVSPLGGVSLGNANATTEALGGVPLGTPAATPAGTPSASPAPAS